MNEFAVIFHWWPRVPVYHGFDNDRLNETDESGDISADFTRCGMLVSRYNRETQRHSERGTWFPAKHADKFARPCRKCFPESAA